MVMLLLGAIFIGQAQTAHAGTGDTVDGRFSKIGIREAGTVLRLDVTGRGGTPNNPSAVALNITATQSSKTGFATIYPCGSSRPSASTINFTPGITVANGIISKVGTNGEVCIYTHQRTHLVIDVNGYFPAGADYKPLNPARLLDSRTGAPAIPAAAAHSLYLLNQLRASRGVAPLVYDAAMSNQALNWSQQMSLSDFRHSGSGYAENIAWHSLGSMSPTTAAATLHDMWAASPGHLNNMINPKYTRVGIGMHGDASGWYGTHMFI
jgi:hypothetical protein